MDDLPGALSDLHARGVRVAGADGEAPLTARQSDLRGPLAIVVGSEGQGLGPVVRRRCDLFMRIPMRGTVGSLNAAVAGSILLFEAVAQRDPAAIDGPATRSVANDHPTPASGTSTPASGMHDTLTALARPIPPGPEAAEPALGGGGGTPTATMAATAEKTAKADETAPTAETARTAKKVAPAKKAPTDETAPTAETARTAKKVAPAKKAPTDETAPTAETARTAEKVAPAKKAPTDETAPTTETARTAQKVAPAKMPARPARAARSSSSASPATPPPEADDDLLPEGGAVPPVRPRPARAPRARPGSSEESSA